MPCGESTLVNKWHRSGPLVNDIGIKLARSRSVHRQAEQSAAQSRAELKTTLLAGAAWMLVAGANLSPAMAQADYPARSDCKIDGLVVVAILEEKMLVAVPSRHELAGAASLDLQVLAKQPFILFSRANSPELYDNI